MLATALGLFALSAESFSTLFTLPFCYAGNNSHAGASKHCQGAPFKGEPGSTTEAAALLILKKKWAAYLEERDGGTNTRNET